MTSKQHEILASYTRQKRGEIGLQIKSERKLQKLTLDKLGKMVGLNKSDISRIERNIQGMQIETFIKIYSALNLPI